MGKIVPFEKPKTKPLRKGNTLCKSGFHKWEIDHATRFDVIEGKLVTVYRCARCGAVRNELR